MLEQMLRIRFFEEEIYALKFNEDKRHPGFDFIGATHLYVGQEPMAAGVVAALKPDDYITSTHRGHGHCIAKGADTSLMMAELMGKEAGYCKGRGGSMHIAYLGKGNLGATAIVGEGYGILTGAALTIKQLELEDRVACGFFGDGSLQRGNASGSFNLAATWQLPVIYIIEENGMGMTVMKHETTNLRFLAQRAMGFGIYSEVVDGTNVLAVYDAAERARNRALNDKPSIIVLVGTRKYGHSLSDLRRSYRTKETEDLWAQYDGIERLKNDLIHNRVITKAEYEKIEQRVRDEIEKAPDFGISEKSPHPLTVKNGLFSEKVEEIVPPQFKTEGIKSSDLIVDRSKPLFGYNGKLLYKGAINEELRQEMARDRRVFLLGEDISYHGGAFGVTNGLVEIFGEERVRNTPISEDAFTGLSVGAALTGLRPVVEIMYGDFICIAMDEIDNGGAKVRYMFGGKAEVPLVLRTQHGGGKGYAGQHSQHKESWLTHIPGLRVVMPSTPYDAKGLLAQAIRINDFVVFIEEQLSYADKNIAQDVPTEPYIIPFGVADIKRKGSDITIITYSRMVHEALAAAEILQTAYGISAEVVDLRTLAPYDRNAVNESFKKTGRGIALAQSCYTGSFTGEIAANLQYDMFDHMNGPIIRVNALDSVPPMSEPLEATFLPNRYDVIEAVCMACNTAVNPGHTKKNFLLGEKSKFASNLVEYTGKEPESYSVMILNRVLSGSN